ncbi:hypothetical protein ACTQ16_15825 [Prevotella sp. LCP21S3_D2]|uniref:hypothetical protein n=1 Tax=Prevotella sp. LCP21S3_D2 TaxID=3438800 RepID=UPI003F981AA2
MSTTTRVIKNTGFLYVKMGITVFISLYTTRLILASLGASDFGVFNIVGGAITMLGFLNSTMANATQRFMSYAEGANDLLKKKQVFNVSMVLHIGVALLTGLILLAAMYPLFNGIFNIQQDRIFAAEVIYLSLVVSTMFTIVNVPYDAVMNAHENMLYYALIGIFEALLKLIVAFACVYTTSDKLIVYGILMAIIPFITLTIMKIYCHRKYEECFIGFKKYWSRGLVKDIASFSGWNFLTAISSLVSYYGSGLVLNHFFGTILNAAQGIANQVNGQMSTFSLNLMKAVNPVIVKRAGAQDVEAMNKATLASGKYSTLLIVFFAIPFMLEMHYVLNVWLKDVPEWTSLFCCLQLVITIICQMASSAATSIYAQGNIKWYAIYKSVMNVVPIIATYIAYIFGGAPYWLYIAMITIWAIGGNIVIIRYANKVSNLKIIAFFREIVFPVISVVILMLALGYLPQLLMVEGFYRFIVSCVITSLVFILMIWWRIFTNKERQMLNDFVKKKRFEIKR